MTQTAATNPLAILSTEQTRRLEPIERRPVGTLMVHEIYTSIQGEGLDAGLPCIFVRLAGCPLRCRWCDTTHAFRDGQAMTIDQLLDAVDALPTDIVELTGGEPLAQPECYELLAALADRKRVLIETSGAMPIDRVDSRVTIIMDIKCPGSGEVASNLLSNLAYLKANDQLKFVLADRADFDWAVDFIDRHHLREHELLFSPVFGELNPADLSAWVIDAALPVRVQLQIHKYVWHPETRGV
ncbi:7-carboxy-7-deazaguanine synthase [Planctomycetes bacterium Pan216]|uniref:7-carboxy-7-deazaguanine synthase n=1 Tax=Kolteria novifilia TaxID=2527975 RepID=A0A518B9B3_9BACT|nr:7-carboxy-7-deazaguanine synthase [Planctomycetes bacterium Pan216]